MHRSIPATISQSPSPASSDENTTFFEDDDSAAWASFSAGFATTLSSLSRINWSSIGDKIADKVVPEWIQLLPGYATKLQSELDMAPGSLADEIWQEAQYPPLHPEIASKAKVRIGKDLCAQELAFLRRRKQVTTNALAKYLDLSEVDARDVPTIAVCGSGGGLRALVAGASSQLSAQEAGLFDCATYTAGVSGSCWLQTLYYSSLGGCRHDRIINHLKRRIGTHIAYPPAFLELFTRAPTNKYLLSGTVEKLKGDPKANFGLVDVYGLLLAARLMVPRDELGVDEAELKLSNQCKYLRRGEHPMPIYSAVRHEIPIAETETDQERAEGNITDVTKKKAMQKAWFQWFEFTPYEMWCEDLDAGIPSKSIGRHFHDGRTITRDNGLGLPELRIPFLMGIWGSAFCATLAHYYKEVRPVVKGLAGFGGIDDLLEEKNDDLIKMHPIQPGAIPNYARGLTGQLPPLTPKSVVTDDYLELMDAGMSNNLPIYPLLRQGRDVDIIVSFDASADIKQENWLSVVDGYAKQRRIKGWPIGAGWPKTEDETKKELNAADAGSAQEAAGKIAEMREEQRVSNDTTQQLVAKTHTERQDESNLGYCNVWVGTTSEERTGSGEPAYGKLVKPDSNQALLSSDAGITVIYFPFLPNPKVPGVDPNTSPYLSTWNFIYTPSEIDSVVALARANFEEGKNQTKSTIRAVYERKKAKRLAEEERVSIKRWKRQLRNHGDQFGY